MGDGGSADGKSPIDIAGLPNSVAMLCDTMLRIDPEWSLDRWLDRCATEELELASSHLGREKMRLEQRLRRVEDIAKQLGRTQETNVSIHKDPFQRNLFDVYDADGSENDEIGKILSEAARAASIPSPIATDDDPLLAIISARILDMAESAHAEGTDSISWEEVTEELIPGGISEEEVDEAFAHLIQNEQLIEFVFGKFTINDVR
tara:strand:+ start:1884 stop:2498 length:615 start_codon:yes stop_codon:yes gene_type:complete